MHLKAALAHLAAGLTLVFLLDHPLIDVLVIAAAITASSRTLRGGARVYLKFAVVAVLLRTAFYAIAGRTGDVVIFRIPQVKPFFLGGGTLGGPVFAEVVLTSLREGTRLVAVIVLLGAFASKVEVADLLRPLRGFAMTPALAMSIGAGLGPEIVRTVSEVADAQKMRGAPRRAIRPVILPVLEQSLNRSLALAESLDSRGFNAQASARSPLRMVAAVAALGASIAAAMWASGADIAVAPVATGLLMAASIAALNIASRPNRSQSLRRRKLSTSDILIIALSAGILAGAIFVVRLDLVVRYDPYESLSLTPPPALASLLAAAVAIPSLIRSS